MSEAMVADCAGLWRRVLLVDSDGGHDTGTEVVWLQGPTGYVDSRGFAGTLHRSGDVFQWHRDIDIEPGPLPDVGKMRWEGDTLVETGVHERYVEHWIRETGPAEPSGALFLTAAEGQDALLVRVGDVFGWATAEGVVIAAVGAESWNELTITADHVVAGGVCWSAVRTEGRVNS